MYGEESIVLFENQTADFSPETGSTGGQEGSILFFFLRRFSTGCAGRRTHLDVPNETNRNPVPADYSEPTNSLEEPADGRSSGTLFLLGASFGPRGI